MDWKSLLIDVGVDEQHHDIIHLYLTELRKRHEPTYEHGVRVGALAAQIADQVNIPKVHPRFMMWVGLMHDIGKLFIPLELLNKTEAFDEMDYAVMEHHVMHSGALLQTITSDLASHIVVRHHSFGTRPYPKELPPIPLYIKRETVESAARILALADFYDALMHRNNDKYGKESLSKRALFLRENADCESLILKLEQEGILNFYDFLHVDYSDIDTRIFAHSSFKDNFLGEWDVNQDAVYSREYVGELLKRGEISKDRAEKMLRMKYETHNGKLRIREEK